MFLVKAVVRYRAVDS